MVFTASCGDEYGACADCRADAALGRAGKKEPEPCVWTVNVTENSWILGCDESKDTSAPPKVCPYCKKRVEVRGWTRRNCCG